MSNTPTPADPPFPTGCNCRHPSPLQCLRGRKPAGWEPNNYAAGCNCRCHVMAPSPWTHARMLEADQ